MLLRFDDFFLPLSLNTDKLHTAASSIGQDEKAESFIVEVGVEEMRLGSKEKNGRREVIGGQYNVSALQEENHRRTTDKNVNGISMDKFNQI